MNNTIPTHEEFRATGFTSAAADYPMSPESLFWLIRFNGADPYKWKPPRAWWYAPNAYMLKYDQERAEKELTKEEISWARLNLTREHQP